MEDLKFYIVTFNCGRELIEVDAFANHLLDGWKNPNSQSDQLPDALVINLQEFAPLSYAFLGGTLVEAYYDRFRQAVSKALEAYGDKYGTDNGSFVNVVTRNIGLTAIMIFARKDLLPSISSLNMAEVGIGDYQLGNKGAVAARIGWTTSQEDRPLCTTFVCAHLAPMEEEVQRRDQNYVDIVKGLVFSKQDAREWRKGQASEENVPLLSDESEDVELRSRRLKGIYCDDSYLFFAGDLNYRTASTHPGPEDFKRFPQPSHDPGSTLHYRSLLSKDQLTEHQRDGKTLHGLKEQPIDFPPTYKYQINGDKAVLLDRDVEEWHWAPHRWPSWCDRVFFSSTEALTVNVGKYSALPLFRTSDHRPVTLCASVPLKPVKDSDFAKEAPAAINQKAHEERITARRAEVLVGTGAYLGLTWEGNSLVLGTVLVLIGGAFVLRNLG